MTITEKKYQMLVQWGGIVLAVSVIFNVYFVLRFREVHRDRGLADQKLQQVQRSQQVLLQQQQAFENVLRGFAARMNTDPKVVEIFRRHQIISEPPAAATNQAQESKP